MKGKLVSIVGILVAISLAVAVGYAGSAGGARLDGGSLFELCGILAFAIQWSLFVPAYVLQTEKFYDLTGSLTYILLALLALAFSGSNSAGSVLIAAMVILWALRLGSFLFLRIWKDGRDVRFNRIKTDFLRFFMTWTLQGLWVFVTFSAGLAALTSGRPHPLDGYVLAGVAMWASGFAIEVIADRQKLNFRKLPENRHKFISSGLWRLSRHPNYFGEILLWTGIAVAAFPALAGWQYLTLVSPCFVYVLLTQISGVKLLEARGRRQWGEDESYQAYLRQTPTLILNPWAGR